MRRPLIAALLAAPLVTVLLVGGPAAHAADEIQVSLDGQTWASSLPQPLFDPAIRWVPGDRRTAAFWIGNRSNNRAAVLLSVTATDPDRLIAGDHIALAARQSGGDWVELDGNGRSRALGGRVLHPGDRAAVQVRASFDPASGNSTQRRRVTLRFRVTLSADPALVGASTADEPGPGPGSSDTSMPSTGGVARGWLVAGLALTFTGGGVLRLSRRPVVVGEREDDDDEA